MRLTLILETGLGHIGIALCKLPEIFATQQHTLADPPCGDRPSGLGLPEWLCIF